MGKGGEKEEGLAARGRGTYRCHEETEGSAECESHYA